MELSEITARVVVRGELRKYYRVARADRWYGGIATADCCGCNLRCVFCWSGLPRDRPDKVGKFHSSDDIFNKLKECAAKHGFNKVRISGNEPTIGRDHLLGVLERFDETNLLFILETNGILIGKDKSYAKDLSKHSCVHVRVSIKGSTPEEFSRLTGSIPEGFNLQVNALRNLLDAGVSCHPAAMLSFSRRKDIKKLLERLAEIDRSLVRNLEEEHVIMYPHVINRLRKAGIWPITSSLSHGVA